MRQIKRLFIILAVLLFGRNPHRTPRKLPYRPEYFAWEPVARRSMYYTAGEYAITDSYTEATFYHIMHAPRNYTGWRHYEYMHKLRWKYGMEMSKLNLN